MKRRPSFPLLPVLAAVLLLQTLLVPALCLAAVGGTGGLAIEICTADGLLTVRQAADDAAGHEEAGHGGACLVCHALPQGAALAAPALPGPAWIGLAVTAAVAESAAPPHSIRGPPSGARAPPAFS